MPTLYPLKVVQKIQETPDSVSLVLKPLAEHQSVFRSYRPAQFLSFEFIIEKKKHLRSYSLSSCPLLDEELKTTVKRVAGGVVSHYIMDHLKEGDCVYSRRPMGKFFKLPLDLKPKHYYLFAGGSGITPLFSVLKTVLLSDRGNQVTLFYANRNEDSIIYRSQLREWVSRYRDRFRLLSFLSRPEGSSVYGSAPSYSKKTGDKPEALPGGVVHLLEQKDWPSESCLPGKGAGEGVYDIKGRLNKSFLKVFFKSRVLKDKSCLYYLCGPMGLMQTVEAFLSDHQVAKGGIRKESFFTALPVPPSVQGSSSVQGSPSVQAPPSVQESSSFPRKRESTPLVLSEGASLDPRFRGGDKARKGSSSVQDPPSVQESSSFPRKRESTSHTQMSVSSELPIKEGDPSLDVESSDVLKVKGSQGSEQQEALPEKIKAKIEGNVVEISATENIPLLEQLLSAGHNPPFSCLSGNCMSCLAVLKQGIVVQDEKGILEDENIQNHEILTCQAKPVSPVVEVDYDHS